MGQLVNLKCEKCGYETNLGVGAGVTFNNLEKVIDLFEKDTQEKIRAAVKANGGRGWTVSKEIGICEKCGKISAIAVFKMTDPSGKELLYHSKCACGSGSIDLKEYEMVLSGELLITCPMCGDVMVITEQGHWD